MEGAMGKFLGISGFDNYTNIAFNNAIEIANKTKCRNMYLAHFLVALLKNNQIRKDFESKTGITEEELLDTMQELTDSGEYGINDTDRAFELNDISDEVKKALNGMISIRGLSGVPVNPMDAYIFMMLEEDTSITDLIAEINPDIDLIDIYSTDEDNMPTLMSVAVNLNKLAAQKKIDPVDARDDIIDQVIEVLGRRQKGNPCLIGDAGVGKTAIIEGLAHRINDGKVPNYLKKHKIISVDISAIVGGTKFRGDFEEKFNNILYEAAGQKNIILFFDEIHTLMNAGNGSEGGTTAVNILKPAIARGDIRIIGATTTREWKKFVEGDSAFERRLQDIVVSEPTVSQAIKMLKKVAPLYTKYHNAIVDDSVIEYAVKLSDRYITNRRLPDKAITVLDETGARIKAKLGNDKVFTIGVSDIRDTISKISGVDITELDANSTEKLKGLADALKSKVIGQDDAVTAVSKAIRRSKSGIKDPNRPIGSFLFVGPTGVGKTELSKALAVEFSGNIKSLIRFDMSEYIEKHSVSKLIGSPPGYVGFGDGGQLTEAVRRNPYSVILFDEIEKAHPDIFNIFLQILDDGFLNDSQGVRVDFKNTVIIMTSNAGYGIETKSVRIGFNSDTEEKVDKQAENKVIRALESTFRPEFLNRLDKVVVFNSLGKEECKSIVELMLNEIGGRLADKLITLKWTDRAIDAIIKEGFDAKYGARNLRRRIQDTIEDEIADMLIDSTVKYGDTLVIDSNDDGGINVKIEEVVTIMEKECAY